jgi:formate hydrogenlyase subunit 3/multisubunit Na+/H+ antiporter MnhD subunit
MRYRKGQGRRTLFRDFAFLGTLGVIGFPFLPTFFGEDVLLHEAFRWHPVIAVSLSSLFAFNGYVAIRALAFTVYKDPKRIDEGFLDQDPKISTPNKPAVELQL